MLEMVKIESKTAIFFVEDDILNIVFKKDADVKLKDVVENLKIRKSIQKGKRMLVLGDIRELWQISTEARGFISDKQVAELNIAMAILAKSLTTKLLANFFIRFNKPASPTKMFTSKTTAIAWLKGFVND